MIQYFGTHYLGARVTFESRNELFALFISNTTTLYIRTMIPYHYPTK